MSRIGGRKKEKEGDAMERPVSSFRSALMAGFLTKQGGSHKSWKFRYFILEKDNLYYFKTPKDSKPTGAIALDGIKVEECTGYAKKRFVFRIWHSDRRTYYMHGKSAEEMNGWIKGIEQALSLNGTNAPAVAAGGEEGAPGSPASGAASPSPSPPPSSSLARSTSLTTASPTGRRAPGGSVLGHSASPRLGHSASPRPGSRGGVSPNHGAPSSLVAPPSLTAPPTLSGPPSLSVPSSPELGSSSATSPHSTPVVTLSSSSASLADSGSLTEAGTAAAAKEIVETLVAPGTPDVARRTKMLDKRKLLANELLLTENVYVESLDLVFKTMVEPLKVSCDGNAGLLTRLEIMDIFSNWEILLKKHTQLRDIIKQRIEEWDTCDNVGDIFGGKNLAFIKLYKHYVNNYDKSLITLTGCMEKNPRFAKYLGKLEYSDTLKQLGLGSYMILPVQRIPRYVMLLSDMLKSTPKGHADCEMLADGLARIKELADYINESKRKTEDIGEVLNIQKKLVDYPKATLAEPGRKFIQEGIFVKAKGNEKLNVFLFNDSLLYSKARGKKFKYKGSIALPTATVQTHLADCHLAIISTAGTFKFNVEPLADREDWITAVKDAISLSQQSMLTTAFEAGYEQLGSEGSKQFQQKQQEESLKKRLDMAQQISLSETEYVSTLEATITDYKEPLLKSLMIPPEKVDVIFSNFDDIVTEHKRLDIELKERMVSWDDTPCLGDIFKNSVDSLRALYLPYILHHGKAIQTLDAAKTQAGTFEAYLKDLESTQSLPFLEAIALPHRRISQYYLMLQELLQYTKRGHEDFVSLSEALTSLKQLSDDIEHKKREKMEVASALRSTSGGGKGKWGLRGSTMKH